MGVDSESDCQLSRSSLFCHSKKRKEGRQNKEEEGVIIDASYSYSVKEYGICSFISFLKNSFLGF